MKARSDISDKLVHFTSGASHEDAFQNLRSILRDGQIVGYSSKIRGNFNCVCFTEAPLTSVEQGLVNPKAHSRYSPFGLMFEKAQVFELGGRPVIYQSEGEYALLPESHQWRHVRYEPSAKPPIDLTWEREWRIKTSALILKPEEVAVIVPDSGWAERLIGEHEQGEDWRVYEYTTIMDAFLAEQYREAFAWRIVTLR